MADKSTDKSKASTAGVASTDKAAWTADELMAAKFPQTREVVPGMLVEGLTVLAGDPKVGKSLLCLQACLDWVNGAEFLEMPVAVGAGTDGGTRRALYLALEDTPRRLQHRIADSLSGEGFSGGVAQGSRGLSIHTKWPQGDVGIKMLDAWLGEHPLTQLVVVDTLAVARETGGGRRGSARGGYAGDYKALRALKAVADKRGVALVAVTHLTKSKSGGGDPFSRIIGSTGVTGAADQMMVLVRAGVGTNLAVLHVRGRDVPERSIEVKLEDGRWLVTGEEAEVRRAKRTELRSDVLRAVDRVGGTGGLELGELLTSLALVDGPDLEAEIDTVRRVLDGLVRAGEIELGADDRYRTVLGR